MRWNCPTLNSSLGETESVERTFENEEKCLGEKSS